MVCLCLGIGCAATSSGGAASGGSNGSGGTSASGRGGGGVASGGGTSGGPGSGGMVPASGGASATGGSGAGGATLGSGGHGGVSGSGAVGGASGGSGASAGAGVGGAVDPCAPRPGLLLCDTFEADAPGPPPAPWTTSITGSGKVTIDATSPANSGTRSVHIEDAASDYDTLLALHAPAILPSATGRFYLRFFIRLAAPMTMGHNSFVLGDLYASQGNGNFLRFSEDNQMLAESIMGDAQGAMSNNKYYDDHQIGVGFTAGRWTCVELLLDHVKPEIDVWVDDVEVPDLHSTAWKIDAYDYLRLGFEKYAGPESEIWYDDIAIGTQKIGCR